MPHGRPALPAALCALACLLAGAAPARPSQTPGPLPATDGADDWLAPYREISRRLLRAAQADEVGWHRLAEMTDTFGPRLSGSVGLENAIHWAADRMRADGFDVRLDPVMVPVWVRGHESAEIVRPWPQPLAMLGLGGSVATPPQGLEAPVLVVRSFEDLDAVGATARGRIVVFNASFTSYNETVQYRTAGPSRAARHGAVAALVRSIGPRGHRTPHTGATSYPPGVTPIPAAAISAEDADQLQRLQDRRTPVVVRLTITARTLPDAPSSNVIAEWRGRERPEEIVVVAGHIDSWDVGTGAVDDGAGCLAAWEALRLMKTLGLQPRRTVRLVLFTNEENGLRGAQAYRDKYLHELDDHVMMLESDIGVFPPLGFGFTGSPGARARVAQIAQLLREIGANRVESVGGGPDIGPSAQVAAIPSLSLEADDTRYFPVHHTHADTVDKIAPDEIARAAAAIAVMAYVVADMPMRLDEQ